MSMLTRKPANSHTLDFLRGLAAVAVVFCHFDGLVRRLGGSIPFAAAGEVGVQLFFVLSGFFIGKSVLSPAEFSPREYCLNRVFRIIPAYYFSMLLIIAFMDASVPFVEGGIGNVFSHLAFLHGWFLPWRVAINGVYWTLSIEWLFYLFMLVFARPIRHPRLGWLVAMGMIAGAVGYKLWMWHQFAGRAGLLNFSYKQLPGMLDQFGCGLVVALLLRQPSVRLLVANPWIKSIGLALSTTAAVAMVMLYIQRPPSVLYWANQWMVVFWPLAFCVSAAGVILFIQQFEETIGPWLDRSRLSFLGVISYSMYLYHNLVIGAFARSWKKVAVGGCPEWLYMTAAALAILLVSWLLYWLVEKPFMEMRTQAKRRAS